MSLQAIQLAIRWDKQMAEVGNNIKELRKEFFLSYWHQLSTPKKGTIAAASYRWHDLGKVRFVYEAEINILLYLGCELDIIAFVQHDGTFAIRVNKWNHMEHYDIVEIIRSFYNE